jgi:LysM repeat protein
MQSQTPQLSVRLLVLLLGLFLVFLFIGRPADADAPVAATEYVVDAGDTLWDIARSNMSSTADIRAVVSSIQELNGIAGGAIYPGQVILVPSG